MLKLKSIFGFIAILVMVQANAQPSYGQLQAVYLYNFAKYIKWPQETPTFVFGILGDVEIIGDLKTTLKGKKVAGKEIEVKIIAHMEDALQCNIVYVSESDSKNIGPLCNTVMGKSILVVTEDDLIKKGAMISFVVINDRLAFKLKKDAIDKTGLTISEGLLKLAILL